MGSFESYSGRFGTKENYLPSLYRVALSSGEEFTIPEGSLIRVVKMDKLV